MSVKHPPVIAVLMAAYNGMDWIGQQTESILQQQHVRVRLFISVDQSSDGTEDWVKVLSQKDPRVKLVSAGKRFGSAGKNFFHLLSTLDLDDFDAVSLSDQDDIWYSDKLIRSWRYITNHSHAVYSSNIIAFWQNGRQKLIKKAYPKKKYDHFFEAGGPGCTYVLTSAIARELKDIINRKKVEELVDLHDWFIYAYCRGREYSWFIDPVPTLYYRQHRENEVGANAGLRAYFKRIRLIKNGWYRQQVEEIIKIVDPNMLPFFRKKNHLIMNAFKLRRRVRDSVFFLIILTLGWY